MKDEPRHGLDRREFVIGMVASSAVGVAATTSAANAEQLAATAPGGSQGTAYTGDIVQGKKVISSLNIADLEPGKKHHLYFQGVQTASGHYWYVSVTVVKGAKPGKRIALVSGVHGDEFSSVRTVQTVIQQLDPATMSGTVFAVFDVSRPAIEGIQRRWPSVGRGVDLVDMNREWPGNENGPTASSRHAGLLFNKVLRPNADYGLDFHTSATGIDMTAFHLARMDLPEVRAMAELFPIEQIFDNPAYPGLLANALIDVGIPAFTPEVGAPRIVDLSTISLFVEGTMNVLKHHGIVAGPLGRTGKDSGIFIGDSADAIVLTHGGFIELLVKLNDKVTAGQKVAIQRNPFGEVVTEYSARVAGKISAIRTDAISEPGNMLITVLYNRKPADPNDPYIE
jgi:predicted deacylase